MPDPAACRLLGDIQELEALSSQWRALYRRDPDATPFQSPEWLLPWWKHFGEGKLLALEVRVGKALAGLLPLYIYQAQKNDQAHENPERQLLPVGVSTSDYLGGVFAPECSAETLAGALELVWQHVGWDVACLSQIRQGSKLAHAIALSAGRQMVAGEGETTWTMPALSIPEFPPKLRRNATYYRVRAERAGAVTFTVANHADWNDCYTSLLTLHRARWQERGEPGVLADERVVAWHRDALPQLLEHDILRLCALRLDGEPIGILYTLIDPPERPNRTQYFYLSGYSPNHAQLSPGTLSLATAIEHAAGEGVQTIDFLRGEETYKKIWHMEPTPTQHFVLNRRGDQLPTAPEASHLVSA